MRDERGLTNGVQVTLLLPLAFGVLLLTMQWALVAWAEATALAAAQDGARQAAALHGRAADGERLAWAAVDNGSLLDVDVAIVRGSTLTEAVVSGRALSVVPGWDPGVEKRVQVPSERVTRS